MRLWGLWATSPDRWGRWPTSPNPDAQGNGAHAPRAEQRGEVAETDNMERVCFVGRVRVVRLEEDRARREGEDGLSWNWR